MTDTNMCGVNQLDVNARLPPRKRLLAGLKNKYCDSPSPSSSSPSSIFNDLNVRLRELLNSSSKGSNLSPEEIVESSRSAALTAAKVAAAARAVAEEKAAIAAKANAAAKSALELLASFSDGEIQQERCLKKSKEKKQVPVKLLYRKRKLVKNHETDEELARKLHRAMNSSPRITKSSSSDSKTRSHKKHAKHITSEKIKRSDGGAPYEVSKSTCDSNYETGAIDHGESICKMFEKQSEYTVNNCSKMFEANVSYSKGQVLGDSAGTNSRKKGRLKQKKLLLSLCSIRDRQNAKDEPDPRIFPAGGEPKGKLAVTDVPLFPTKPSSESEVSLGPVRKWKLKEFNTPQCYNGSDILRPLCSNSSVTTASAMIEVDQ
ncbi:hypothetical protein Scep_000097 [Stephania cephalantha]|uniref:Uncharacterized protein n=1 Tax=Stephania cephalantha TaxID=152367 RepID=A0AAP0Q6C1_9MAGN